MDSHAAALENNASEAVSTAAAAPPAFARKRASDATSRELFYELLVLALANLYTKMPLGTTLFDRGMIRAVTGHLADNDAGKLTNKAEDWIRLENLVRAQEGQKSYAPTAETMAALESTTAEGSLGQLMEKAALSYATGAPGPDIRRATRKLAAAFLTQLKG